MKRVKLSLSIRQATELWEAAGQMRDDMSPSERHLCGKTKAEADAYFEAMGKLEKAMREAKA